MSINTQKMNNENRRARPKAYSVTGGHAVTFKTKG